MDFIDLVNAGTTSLYRPQGRCPKLVREHHLPGDFKDGPDTIRQAMHFREDIRCRPNSLTANDFVDMYRRHRITQGHAAPRANFRNSFAGMRDSYLYSNCWGQHEACNLGPINKIDRYIRRSTDDTDEYVKIWTLAEFEPWEDRTNPLKLDIDTFGDGVELPSDFVKAVLWKGANGLFDMEVFKVEHLSAYENVPVSHYHLAADDVPILIVQEVEEFTRRRLFSYNWQIM